MATFTTTAKYALRWLTGSNLISDVDAGFQALAEDIDSRMAGYAEGTAASRPAAGVAGRLYGATDIAGELARDTGSAWVNVSPGYGTALPTSNLYDGQRFIYTADAANGIRWELRYNASGGTYKWEFVGGADLEQHQDAVSSVSLSATFVDSGSPVGPTLTVPSNINGVFDIYFNVFLASNNSTANEARASIQFGTTTATNGDGTQLVGNGTMAAPVVREMRRIISTVNDHTLKLVYRANPALGSGPYTASLRVLRVRPVMLG